MKKWKIVSALALVGCLSAMALSACGGEEQPPAPESVQYTLKLADQDDLPIAGVELTLMDGETQIAVGTTDENGEVKGTAIVGDYMVEIGDLPDDYWSDLDIVQVNISKLDAVVELEVENVTPNGTAERPFYFVSDGEGEMEITLPAGATHIYGVPRPQGRPLVINGEGFTAVYNGVTYQPSEGKATIEFNSGSMDTYAVEAVAFVNMGTSDLTLRLELKFAPGQTQDTPIVITDLSQTYETTIVGSNITYYAFTATQDCRVTVSSSSAKNQLLIWNENSETQTDWVANCVSMQVSAGDYLIIQVGVDNTVTSSTEENTISFNLSVA